MRAYEGLFVLDPTLTEEELDKVVGVIEEHVKRAQGEIDGVERWGRKSMAYPVKRKKEGFYILVNFKADPAAIKELKRSYRLTEQLLRSSIHLRVPPSKKPQAEGEPGQAERRAPGAPPWK